MRTFAILLTSLLAAAALAGCADDATPPTATPAATATPVATPAATPTPTPTVTVVPTATPTPTTTPPLDSSTYALEAVGFPAQAKPGQRFNFTLYANGSVTHESDHIGAHYADNDTTNPPAAGRKDCEHVAGTLPDSFVVHCTINDVGTWYVWGHARIDDSGELRNWWPASPAIVRVRDYNVTLSDVPTTVQPSNQSFTVNVHLAAIDGSENATSDHIGIHFWNATEDEPTVQNSAGACEHVGGGSIGNYTVSCTIVNAGITPATYYLRGHLRLAESGTVLSWWSDEHEVTIGPGLVV